MATINLGNLTFTHKGDYAGGTAYVKNDVVYYATNGNSYIAKTSTTGNAPTSTSHWDLFVAGSSGIWNAGLSLGSAGQSVKVNSAGNALEFGTISAGTYSVHAISKYNYQGQVNKSCGADYVDISGGNYVQFQPTSTNDFIYLSHGTTVYNSSNDSGTDVYMMMKEGASTIGSGDTKLNYDGNHAHYTAFGSGNMYSHIYKSFILPCTGLNTSSVYYLEQAGATHNSNQIQFNLASSNASGSYRQHNVTLIHYKA